MINIISTGSGGNAVLYNEQILVDCGVSFSKLKPFLKEIKIVLLTHCHQDHLNLKTLQKLQQERPTLRVGCGKWLLEELHGIKNIDVLEVGSLYHYGLFKVSPVKLYHDVENCGYRLFFNDEKKKNLSCFSRHRYGSSGRDFSQRLRPLRFGTQLLPRENHSCQRNKLSARNLYTRLRK